MNSAPDPTLHRDLFAASAASLRRSQRRRRAGVISFSTIALFVAFSILLLRPGPLHPPLAPAQPPTPVPAPAPAPASDSLPPAPPYQSLSTDQELLAALADQGPMLITHPDGRRQLILTRPH